LTSAGYSRKLGRIVAFGYVKAQGPLDDDALQSARCEVDVAGTTYAATILPSAR
jgi:glycine cleavage system aminomethyltransferase T